MRPIRARSRRFVWLCSLSIVSAVAHVPLAAAQAAPKASEPSVSSPATDEYARAVEAAVEAYNRDDFANARRYFARAHELRPSARTWRGMGTTAFELKYYEDAVRELTFALEDTRSALPANLRAETELTLRVARRHLAEDRGEKQASAKPEAASTAALPPAPSAAHEATTHEGGLGGQRVAALVAGGLGVVAVGVGVGFGLRSLAKGRERDRLCPASEQAFGCSAEAKRAADAAITSGNLSTVGWVVGGVGLGSALVLWLTASERSNSDTTLSVGPGTFSVAGRF